MAKKNLLEALKALFQRRKRIDATTEDGQRDAFTVAKHLVGLAEVMFPGSGQGRNKRDAVASALNAIIDLPGLTEEQEQVLFSTLIQAAGLALGLWVRR